MGRLQLTLIDYPSGRFGFVGTVPTDLAVDDAGNKRVWDTADAARAEAKRLGYEAAAECISKRRT